MLTRVDALAATSGTRFDRSGPARSFTVEPLAVHTLSLGSPPAIFVDPRVALRLE